MMNRIFQVIWNETKHAYVAASEFATKNGKRTMGRRMRSHAAVVLAALVLTTGAGMGAVQAAGTDVEALQKKVEALTTQVEALKNAGIVAGKKEGGAIAIGGNNNVYVKGGQGAIAVGDLNTHVDGVNQGIAIGNQAKVYSDGTRDHGGIAIGGLAGVTNARYSAALGVRSLVDKSDLRESDEGNGVVSVGASAGAAEASNNKWYESELKTAGQPKYQELKRRIINVRDGVLESDAATVGQLERVQDRIIDNSTAINQISGNVNQLGDRVNRVGAGAAALAALHPLDYDPANKWDFAAGYGNYKGANAVSIGSFYRPNENVMLSVGGSFGGGENMVNAGVSFKIGEGSSAVGTSRAAMAAEISSLKSNNKALEDKVTAQDQKIKEMEKQLQQLLKAQNPAK